MAPQRMHDDDDVRTIAHGEPLPTTAACLGTTTAASRTGEDAAVMEMLRGSISALSAAWT
ncbi:hypothetical protein GCM10009594_11620 [Kocuria palustris]